MAEKGHIWSNTETKLLLDIWSQQHIQKQLQGSFRNVNVYAQLVEELRKKGYVRIISQCRIKIKALKKRYKDIVDRARRSGAGNESDTEEDLPSDSPYYSQNDAVMAGRPAVTPVHLLDSASYTEENEFGLEDNETVAPGPLTSQQETPGPSTSQQEPPGPSTSRKENPNMSLSRPETTSPFVSRTETPDPSLSRSETLDSSVSRPVNPSSSAGQPGTTGSSAGQPKRLDWHPGQALMIKNTDQRRSERGPRKRRRQKRQGIQWCWN